MGEIKICYKILDEKSEGNVEEGELLSRSLTKG
jgi:hypothetical protein